MLSTELVSCRVTFGFGVPIRADLRPADLEELPAGELLHKIATQPQPTSEARLTARALGETIRSGRPLHVEVLDHPKADVGSGRPISREQPVVPPGGAPTERPKAIELLASEPYVGGR